MCIYQEYRSLQVSHQPVAHSAHTAKCSSAKPGRQQLLRVGINEAITSIQQCKLKVMHVQPAPIDSIISKILACQNPG